ncbi:hypothetical protein H4R35_005645, partial [Dimargaris xerosporica]
AVAMNPGLNHPMFGLSAGQPSGDNGNLNAPFPIFNPPRAPNHPHDARHIRAQTASAQRAAADLRAPSGMTSPPLTTTAGGNAASGSSVYQTEFTKRRNWSHRIINEITDMIQVISPSGKIMFCSPSTAEVVGYTPEELVGRSITDFIHVDDVDTYVREFNMAIIQRDFRLFYRFRRKDDHFILLEVVGHPWFTTDGMAGADPQTTSPYPNSDLAAASLTMDLNATAQASAMAMAANQPDDANHMAAQAVAAMRAGPVAPDSGLAGFPVARCFFSIARPYPVAATARLDSLLELKMENERLIQQYQQMGGDPETLVQIIGTMNDSEELSALRQRLAAANQPDYLGALSHQLDGSAPFGSVGGLGGDGSTSGGDVAMITDGSGMVSSAASTASTAAGAAMGPGGVSAAALMASQAKRKKRRTKVDTVEHVCTDCGTVESPEWRKGPQGPKTLCNACGLRWAKKNKKQDIDAAAAAAAAAAGMASSLGTTTPSKSSGSSHPSVDE